ncbi:tripartite tricarboxylate transporter substrate-binding protein [Rhodoferax koreense]|nr:tripartite tricarboxylate transporter substrate-binding protein [Rhodoferax koreense]
MDNRTGASGNIVTMEVVRARPDGYTLLLQNVSMATNDAAQGKLPYALTTDLTPLMLLSSTPHAIVAHPGAHISSIAELVDAAKAAPSQLTYASCGIGTPQHFAMKVLRQNMHIDMLHVGYKGCAPALVDVLGGQVPVAILSANLVPTYAQTGRLKALAVTTAKRYPQLPTTPSVAEQGGGNFDYDSWYALMAPGKLPTLLADKITADVLKVLDEPSVRSALAEFGIDISKGTAQELKTRIVEDSDRYLELARQNNIKAE